MTPPATGVGIVWDVPPSHLADGLTAYEKKVKAAIVALVEYFEPILESYAKSNAPWTDRTANARQSLFTVHEVASDMVTLYLSHGMEYGVFLEVCNAGKYAIIMKTLQAHYSDIKAALDRLLA